MAYVSLGSPSVTVPFVDGPTGAQRSAVVDAGDRYCGSVPATKQMLLDLGYGPCNPDHVHGGCLPDKTFVQANQYRFTKQDCVTLRQFVETENSKGAGLSLVGGQSVDDECWLPEKTCAFLIDRWTRTRGDLPGAPLPPPPPPKAAPPPRVPLTKPGGRPSREAGPGGGPGPWPVLVILTLAVGGGFWYFSTRRPQVAPARPRRAR